MWVFAKRHLELTSRARFVRRQDIGSDNNLPTHSEGIVIEVRHVKSLAVLVIALTMVLGLILPAQGSVRRPPRSTVHTGSLTYATAAAEGMNAEVEAWRLGIEHRYGIRIRYDVDFNGSASIGTGALQTLDLLLGYLTPGVIRELSSYWEQRTGNLLTFSFVYSPFQRNMRGGEVLGSFSPSTGTIELYIPSFSENVFISGESPLTIMHELGHAFHFMIADFYGEDELYARWTALNGGIQYTGRQETDFDSNTFVSSYSMISYKEDFAETFAHAFVRRNAGQGFTDQLRAQGGGLTNLGQKVQLIEQFLPIYFQSDTTQMVANYRRVWTAPTSINFYGMRIAGYYTQYIGFTHPRFVLRSLVGMLDIEMENYRWMPQIGGWVISSTAGQHYAVFPGGTTFIFRTPPPVLN